MKQPFNIHYKNSKDQKCDTISVLVSKFQLNCTKLSKTEHKRNAELRIYFLDGKMIKLKSGNNTSGTGMYVQYISTVQYIYTVHQLQHRD